MKKILVLIISLFSFISVNYAVSSDQVNYKIAVSYTHLRAHETPKNQV